jgi:hypothetical protein
MIPQEYIDRFHAKYMPEPNTGCWIWIGGYKSNNRAQFFYPGTSGLASRISWMIHNGDIPPNIFVCHRCDNTACVNPQHLFLGTHQDNVDDKVAKSRQARNRGRKAGGVKLTQEQVNYIRGLADLDNDTARDLAKSYGVHWRHLFRIRSGERWLA